MKNLFSTKRKKELISKNIMLNVKNNKIEVFKLQKDIQ